MQMTKEPTFFAGRRLSVYFKGGRLMKDKKTDQRFWRFKWALTLNAGDAHACGGAIQSTYEHIQARENAAEVIELRGAVGGMISTVFDTSESGAGQVLRLDRCFLDRFKMTYADGVTEFWIQLEHDLTDQLHNFVKTYAFQRFFVEFSPKQISLTDAVLNAAEKMQDHADRDGVTMTLTSEGKKLAEFKPRHGKPN